MSAEQGSKKIPSRSLLSKLFNEQKLSRQKMNKEQGIKKFPRRILLKRK